MLKLLGFGRQRRFGRGDFFPQLGSGNWCTGGWAAAVVGLGWAGLLAAAPAAAVVQAKNAACHLSHPFRRNWMRTRTTKTRTKSSRCAFGPGGLANEKSHTGLDRPRGDRLRW